MEIDKAIRLECKRKWQNAPHYKHTKHFYSSPDKNAAKKILNISRSHLTRFISIITGFNCLSYIQFKANPSINPLCRLRREENETFWDFVMECPRLNSFRNDTFLVHLHNKITGSLNKLCNLMSYNQEYDEQLIHELDL